MVTYLTDETSILNLLIEMQTTFDCSASWSYLMLQEAPLGYGILFIDQLDKLTIFSSNRQNQIILEILFLNNNKKKT